MSKNGEVKLGGKIIFTPTKKGYTNFRTSIPKVWIDEMEVTKEDFVKVSLIDNKIVIEKQLEIETDDDGKTKKERKIIFTPSGNGYTTCRISLAKGLVDGIGIKEEDFIKKSFIDGKILIEKQEL